MIPICAVIALGGHGSRLKSITGDIPKPLFPIAGQSTLFRCCSELRANGIRKIILTVSYKFDDFKLIVGSLQAQLDLDIEIFIEDYPLGECGALWRVSSQLTDNFLFVNGDLVFSMDLVRLYNFHSSSNADLTLVTHVSDHPYDSDLLIAPNGFNVKQISPKNQPEHASSSAYLGNAGIAMVNKNVLNKINPPDSLNQSSLFHHIVANGISMINFKLFSYNTSEYIKDMGTPDRFKRVDSDLKLAIPLQKSYSNKQRVLFVDRDNTLLACSEGDYVIDPDSLVFLVDNILKLAALSASFDFVCLVTNQPQISMGFLSVDQLDTIHGNLIRYCLDRGLRIDITAFCPHHPHTGFDGELGLLKTPCFCRKPNPGLLIEQSYFRNIDLNKSLLVGDSVNDQLAASRAGCEFIFVQDL